MGKSRYHILTGIIAVLSFILFAYKFPSSFVFADDFTRDLYDILGITRGKLTLLGPALSFGGLRSGPYYYYLFAPVFFLTRASIDSVLYFNAGLFALALGFFFYKIYQRVNTLRALVTTIALTLLPVYLFGARSPSNGFSYLPLLLVFLTIITFQKKLTGRAIFLLGVLGGITANFHFVALPLFFLLFLVIFFQLKDRVKIIPLVIGFGLTFLPLIFFEVRHGLVITKTTLSLKEVWMKNRNLRDLPDTVLPDKYIPSNFFIILDQTARWLGIQPLIVFTLGGLAILTERKKSKAAILFLLSTLFFLLLAILLRYQFSPHYLVPYSLALFFSLTVVLGASRWWWLLIPIIIFETLAFPKQLYSPSNSTPERFEKAVDFVIANQFIDRASPFNVLRLVNRTSKVTLGYEYRYFLRLKGYEPRSISEFRSAKTLLVFSDLRSVDLNHLGSWEIDQFGREYFGSIKTYMLGQLTIYSATSDR